MCDFIPLCFTWCVSPFFASSKILLTSRPLQRLRQEVEARGQHAARLSSVLERSGVRYKGIGTSLPFTSRWFQRAEAELPISSSSAAELLHLLLRPPRPPRQRARLALQHLPHAPSPSFLLSDFV